MRKREHAFAGISIALIISLGAYGIMSTRNTINPAAYTPLLTLIARSESRGNYNAYFGNTTNTSVRFTDMTLDEVLAWQTAYVQQGSPSNAVGRYQIIQPTLEHLIARLHLNHSAKFDESLQDKLAIALIEQRGAVDFIKQSISAEDFSHNLSQEWAALPRIKGEQPNASYYAGDGVNKALIDSRAVLGAVDEFKQKAKEKL